MTTTDAARRDGERLAREGKLLDPSSYRSAQERNAAETAFKAEQERIRKQQSQRQ